jgi:uncharacterized protein (TIGR00297 family)|tara:strand:- start:9590 stop:10366 length:777 start_codon:yes stop_codon:yes gene_type:complete
LIDELSVPTTVTILFIIVVSFSLSFYANYSKVLDKGGSVLAFLICFVSGVFGHWSWLLILLIFVGSSFLATRFAIVYKKALGVEESDEGTRGGSNVISNGIVPPLIALAYSFDLLTPEQALVAFTTSMAAASADTMASEIGVLSPSPVLITNPRKIVEPGVDGGVSFEGLTASFLSAVSISMLSYAGFLVLIEDNHPFSSSIELNHLFISVFFGFFGSILDSFLGATMQNRGFLSNNGVNLASISISVLLSLFFLAIL